ncbi:MAG: hypothetical protein PVF58_04135 [Candidatus Methanofastidiosia archaeon]|jgi:hypothetical protein
MNRRGRAIDPDIIHIEIARYVEIFGNPGGSKSTGEATAKKVHGEDLGEINLSKLVDIIQDDMKQEELEEKIDVSYDIVRNRYIEMVERSIIYPGFGLDMMKFDYTLSFCLIKKDEIYRIMKAFSQFSIVTALAYTENDNLLHLQYPKDKENDIFQILNYLDAQNEVLKIIKVHNNRAIPHYYYFHKERK